MTINWFDISHITWLSVLITFCTQLPLQRSTGCFISIQGTPTDGRKNGAVVSESIFMSRVEGSMSRAEGTMSRVEGKKGRESRVTIF